MNAVSTMTFDAVNAPLMRELTLEEADLVSGAWSLSDLLREIGAGATAGAAAGAVTALLSGGALAPAIGVGAAGGAVGGAVYYTVGEIWDAIAGLPLEVFWAIVCSQPAC